MEIRQFAFDKEQIGGLISKAYSSIREFLRGIVALVPPLRQAPDDFATKPEIPTWEEYEAASNAQILDRLHRNPGGLLNEQPFIDTLMNVRNAENNRKQTKYLTVGFYALAFSALVLAFKAPSAPPPPPPGQAAEQQRAVEKAVQDAADLLRQEFALKLQSKDAEIKDLRRQISLLNQSQGELGKQLKSLAKSARPAAKPAAVQKPQEPPKAPAPAQPPSRPKPPKPN